MANELEKNAETVETEKENSGGAENTPSASELEARIKKLESENEKLRQANTNASADASKWKKQYQDMLPEQERLKKQQEEQEATLREQVKALQTERNVANHKSQLTAPDIGCDGATAQEIAEALSDMSTEDAAKIFNGLRKFLVAHDKQLKENAFRTNKTLPGGDGTKPVTKEQFDAMGYKERVDVFNKYPELYQEYTK